MAINKTLLIIKDPNRIQAMFNDLAPRYDLLNRVLSGGYDQHWRKIAVNQLGNLRNKTFLDVATGTADIVLEIAKRSPPPLQIIGMDFSQSMLKLGSNKINKIKLKKEISLIPGSAESIPLKDQIFDGAITAFGVRNFSDVHKGILEMHRVLKPNGKVVVLEFSFPNNRLLKWLYRFYFEKILPIVGRIISGHKNAYSYLPESVANFPQGESFKKLLEDSGFKKVSLKKLTLGIVTLYTGIKNA